MASIALKRPEQNRCRSNALARQVLGERLAHRPAPFEPGDRRLRLRRSNLGQTFVLGGGSLHLLELQLELVEQALLALGALAVELAPKLLDLATQMRDQRLAPRRQSPGPRCLGRHGICPRLGRRQCGTQGFDLGSGLRHGGSLHHRVRSLETIIRRVSLIPPRMAARSGAGSASRCRPACRQVVLSRSRPPHPSAPAI